MHVKFSYQSELPKLSGTSRNKPHLEPWPESPAANSPVSLGRVADGPPDKAGRSASSDKNQQRLCTILSLSQIERRTVRDLVREHVFTQHGPHLTGGRSAKWSAV